MKSIKKTDLKKPFKERIVYDANTLLNELGDYKYLVIRFANIYSDWRDDLAQKLLEIDRDHFINERSSSPQGADRMGKFIVSHGNDKAIDVVHIYTRYYATDIDSEHFILDSDIMDDILSQKDLLENTKDVILLEVLPNFNYEWVEELEKKYKIKFVGIK